MAAYQPGLLKIRPALLANAVVNKIARPPRRGMFHSPISRRLNLRRSNYQEPVGFLLTGRVTHSLLLTICALFPIVTGMPHPICIQFRRIRTLHGHCQLGVKPQQRKVAQCNTTSVDHSLAASAEMPQTLRRSLNQNARDCAECSLTLPFAISIFVFHVPNIASIPE